MKIANSLVELRKARLALPEPVGLVPTMGYLHDGHLSLIGQARQSCNSVVVTIFVNPTQFAANEDLSKYPRNLARDLDLLQRAGVGVVWTPDESDIYPAGFQSAVTVEKLSQRLEGAMRPEIGRASCRERVSPFV